VLRGGAHENSLGAAWVFTRSGSTWTQQGEKLTGTNEIGEGDFGWSVALSGDGNTALIGGLSDNDYVGAAWVFTRSGSTWTQQGEKLTGTNEIGAGFFGWSVALSGDGSTALIGGFWDNSYVGAAWVFTNQTNGGGSGSGGSGSGGQGNTGGGGKGSSHPQAPEVTSVSSPIGDNKLPGGPVSGGTQITITGSGFVPGATQVWIEPTGVPATSVAVHSSTQLTAIAPSVSMFFAGKHTVRVNTPHGSSATLQSAANSFYYYVPQVGTLVFRDPSLAPSDKDYYDQCTASVVSSNNEDVISTAGHCVTSGTTWHDEIVFAPGYYGPFGPPQCPIVSHTEEALCGVAPYGWWHARLLVANEMFRINGTAGLDYGFIGLQSYGGVHVQQAVGGGLPIAFCQGTSLPLHPICDAGSGKQEHYWTAYGEPNTEVGLQNCGPGPAIGSEFLSSHGPENLILSPCTVIVPGASGGPWISSANTVGAINQGVFADQAAGTYLGGEARDSFDEAQGGRPSAATMSVVSQNAHVSAGGIAAISASCPGPRVCRGIAELTSQQTGAITAATRNTKRKTVLDGRAHFAIRPGKKLVIHLRLMPWAHRRLRHRHSKLLATLTLRAIHVSALKLPITLSR
jgi:hypothetical protein